MKKVHIFRRPFKNVDKEGVVVIIDNHIAVDMKSSKENADLLCHAFITLAIEHNQKPKVSLKITVVSSWPEMFEKTPHVKWGTYSHLKS